MGIGGGPVPKTVVRRRNKREVKGTVTTALPERPASMTGEALAEWERIVPVLDEMGTLNTVDRMDLIRWCALSEEWLAATEEIKVEGHVVVGDHGGMVRNPRVLARNNIGNELGGLSKSLNLSASARLRSGIKHTSAATEETPVGVTAIEDYKKRLAK